MDFCRQAQSFKPLASCCSTCATSASWTAQESLWLSASGPYLAEMAGNGMGAAGMHGLVWLNAADVFTVGLEEWHVTERWWETLQSARITKQLPAVEIYGGERICFEYQNTRPQKHNLVSLLWPGFRRLNTTASSSGEGRQGKLVYDKRTRPGGEPDDSGQAIRHLVVGRAE